MVIKQTSTDVQIDNLSNLVHKNLNSFFNSIWLFTVFNNLIKEFDEISQRVLVHRIYLG